MRNSNLQIQSKAFCVPCKVQVGLHITVESDVARNTSSQLMN